MEDTSCFAKIQSLDYENQYITSGKFSQCHDPIATPLKMVEKTRFFNLHLPLEWKTTHVKIGRAATH